MSRILFVLDIGFDRGGPSVHLLQDVLRAALKQGHTVDVILKETGGTGKIMPDEFANHKNFNYFSIKEVDEKKYGFVGRYLQEVKYAYKCSKIFLNNGKYDSVFLQSNTVAYFYMRLLDKLRCRIVFNVQDIFPYNLKLSGQLPFEIISFPVFRKLQNLAYKKANTIITISDDMKQTLVDDGVDAGKIKVVYNWSYADTPISLENIDDENIYDLKMDHNKLNVVYAGNIGKMQNVELIAKASKEMKNEYRIHFYIIGDGANKRYIESMVQDQNNVTLLPMQAAKYAESIYAQADLNIIPLMPGGIKTALPSKTATVLRVNRPVVFCIDKESLFQKKLCKQKGVFFADCCGTEEFKEAIYDALNFKNRANRLFLSDGFFMSVNNSMEYVCSLNDIRR